MIGYEVSLKGTNNRLYPVKGLEKPIFKTIREAQSCMEDLPQPDNGRYTYNCVTVYSTSEYHESESSEDIQEVEEPEKVIREADEMPEDKKESEDDMLTDF